MRYLITGGSGYIGSRLIERLADSDDTERIVIADIPVPIDEDQPVRGVPDFEYARDKTECDRLCQLWALRHPDRVMTIVRPCIVFGPNVDNYIVRAWTKQPFFADLGGPDQPVQFAHEDDVVEALMVLLEGRHAGAFNLAGDGTMTWRECAEGIGTPGPRGPKKLFWAFGRLMWRLHAAETPPGNLHFIIHPWVVSTDRLKATGWTPRYTSRETFEITMRTQGKLPPSDTPAEPPQVAAPVGA